jgi:glutaredoxin
MKHKIEIFSAGCPVCKETIATVRRIAGDEHEIQIHDMHREGVARSAKRHGVRSLPAIVIDGELSGCCVGRGPYEVILRETLRR